MTTSEPTRRQRRTTGLSVALLALATVALAIAFSAVGQEILTLPDSRQEAAEIAARLPVLRADRDALLDEVAAHKAELSSLRTRVEEARDIAGRLPDLRAEETRARAERDRLTREVSALVADRDSLRGTVDQLVERRRGFEDEHQNLVDRSKADRDALLDEVAAHKAELSSLRTRVEEARDIAGRLPDLRAEETRARAERDRLTREVSALVADRDSLRGTVDQLVERRRGFEDEHQNLVDRSEAERKRLDEVRQAVGEGRASLTQIRDEHAAQTQKLAQLMTDLADTDRLLESKRAELKSLTIEEQDLRTRVARLQEEGEKLEIGNQQAADQSATLHEELAKTRTALTTIQGQRDQARDELARARAMRDVEQANLETVSIRLQHLTSLEARAQQQLRAMIEDLSAVEQTRTESESSQ